MGATSWVPTGWRMVPSMIWLGQLSRMIWTSLCRRRDSVKNLASAANGSGDSVPSASRLNVGHWGRKKTQINTILFNKWAFSQALGNVITSVQSKGSTHSFLLQIPAVNQCLQEGFSIKSVFSMYYCYPLLADVTLLYMLSVFSLECGKTPDRYKHNRQHEQTGLWTTRQRTPWNGCNILKWEMKKISYLEWPIGKAGLGERDWWGNLAERIWHWWNKHRWRGVTKMSRYTLNGSF